MFNWLKSWFAKDDSDTVGTFRLKDRKIYIYHDGEKEVRADPMILYKGLMANGPELAAELKIAMSSLAGSAATEAHNSAISQIRTVFGIKPLANGGLTEGETLDLMGNFWEYMESLKKNTNQSATSATETLPNSTSFSDGLQPTRSSSASGHAETGHSTDGLMPSPSAPG